jgi:alpha-galactosidase
MGLKAGIYSTPWTATYAGRVGGSSTQPSGEFVAPRPRDNRKTKQLPFAIGPVPFAAADAKQWAAWGFDYLKYDWAPIDVPSTKEMAEAIKASGRDMVLSLSNNGDGAVFGQAVALGEFANSWRTTDDIRDTWNLVKFIGFEQTKWAGVAGPGKWNDADMLVLGYVGWGPRLHPTRLTPDEQYTHMSLWCLLASPLLIGCDLERLDPFTLGLLTNDEVLAVNQDELGVAGACVAKRGDVQVWRKPLADGSMAVGLFNLSNAPATATFTGSDVGMAGPIRVRDLWRQQDLGGFEKPYETPVAPHGVVLLRVRRG